MYIIIYITKFKPSLIYLSGVGKTWNNSECENISIGQKVGTWFKRSKIPYKQNIHLSSNEENSNFSSS